jgi:hypothetical protein
MTSECDFEQFQSESLDAVIFFAPNRTHCVAYPTDSY